MTSALQITIDAPVASFRNPLYSGVQVTLPCPPPSTVAGLLAAAVGGWERMPPDTRFAMAFTAQGQGVDLETFHPLATAGKKPTPAPKDHEFLAHTTLTLWVFEHLDLWERALRRPVWPLRLGRSQDLASARTGRITLHPGPGTQGHALLPAEASKSGMQLRMPHTISPDRSRIQWGTYRYASHGSSAHLDSPWCTSEGQAIVPLAAVHPHTGPGPQVELAHLWAKSPDKSVHPPPPGEALTTHLRATTHALDTLHARIGTPTATDARFWNRARLACLFHDAGKVPDGFQTMVGNPPPAQPWGRRHEVYSLAFVEHVLTHLPEDERTWIGLGVLTHHRPLAGGEGSIRNETRTLINPQDFHDHFAPVEPTSAHALATWLARNAQAPTPQETTPQDLAHAGHRLLERILTHWERGQSPDERAGLTAALLQGAITLADHVASAHGRLLTTHPLTTIDYPTQLRSTLKANDAHPYP
ncbi:CRISPR-associated endonuclease Cas3'', partial [Nocardiopsis sp. MG754419]|uniref:CRISPR-associated endonuclease Cas3'' n=1 Tax=Nocardiopsis sp. MG754419 TaxID=2259865 RepID=UPI001BAD1840